MHAIHGIHTRNKQRAYAMRSLCARMPTYASAGDTGDCLGWLCMYICLLSKHRSLPEHGFFVCAGTAPVVPDETTVPSPVAAAAPAQSPAIAPALAFLAPVQAPAQELQQPAQNPQDTMLDGVLQLQGQRLWPFDDKAQAALTSALATVMPAMPRDQVKILDSVQASILHP